MASVVPITPEMLKRTTLVGVNLTSNGVPFPNALYQNAIRGAVRTLENRTGVVINERVITDERCDRDDRSLEEFSLIKTNWLPLKPGATLSLAFYYGTQKIIDIPESWLNVRTAGGHVEIVPVGGLTVNIVGMTFALWWTNQAKGAAGRWPDWYSLSYTAGWEEGDLFLLHDAVSDLTAMFEAHRIVDAGSPKVHLAADDTNSVLSNGGWDVWEDYSGDIDELNGQLNAVRLAYIAHIADTDAHTVADAVNVLSSPAATNLASAVTLINELIGKFGAHERLVGAGPVHGQADTINLVTAGRVRADYAKLDDEIRDCLTKLAAIPILHRAGDLIAGAGIASRSTSLDGLSESVNTTSSATNSGYGAFVGNLQKEIKAHLASIRSRYIGMILEA